MSNVLVFTPTENAAKAEKQHVVLPSQKGRDQNLSKLDVLVNALHVATIWLQNFLLWAKLDAF